MSLDYNLSKIEDFKEVCFTADGEMRPDTHGLIFSTIVVGLPEITEANQEVFLARLNSWEHVRRLPITPHAVVRRHVGLKTNAERLSSAQFVSRVKKNLWLDIPVEYRSGV